MISINDTALKSLLLANKLTNIVQCPFSVDFSKPKTFYLDTNLVSDESHWSDEFPPRTVPRKLSRQVIRIDREELRVSLVV